MTLPQLITDHPTIPITNLNLESKPSKGHQRFENLSLSQTTAFQCLLPDIGFSSPCYHNGVMEHSSSMSYFIYIYKHKSVHISVLFFLLQWQLRIELTMLVPLTAIVGLMIVHFTHRTNDCAFYSLDIETVLNHCPDQGFNYETI